MVFMDEGPWYPSLELPQEPSTLKSLASHVKTLVDGVRFASTWHTLFMLLLSCLATFLCTKGMLDMSFDTSMSIVAVGTVFPLVFSVQASFQRRERALAALASLKAAIFTIYLMFKTWEIESTGKWASEVEELLHKLLDDIEHFLRHPNRPELRRLRRLRDPRPQDERLRPRSRLLKGRRVRHGPHGGEPGGHAALLRGRPRRPRHGDAGRPAALLLRPHPHRAGPPRAVLGPLLR